MQRKLVSGPTRHLVALPLVHGSIMVKVEESKARTCACTYVCDAAVCSSWQCWPGTSGRSDRRLEPAGRSSVAQTGSRSVCNNTSRFLVEIGQPYPRVIVGPGFVSIDHAAKMLTETSAHSPASFASSVAGCIFLLLKILLHSSAIYLCELCYR